MKRCTKTWSGRHIFIKEVIYYTQYSGGGASGGGGGTTLSGYIKCYACGMYDDRTKKGKVMKRLCE